jgi:phosphatidylglycerophosphate synthase
LLAGPAFAASITEPAIIDAGADTRDASDAAARTVQVTGVYPWMAALILARELLITSLRGVCEARGVDFSASLTGKLKMIAQSISVPLILVLVAIAASAAATGEIDTVERLALVNLIIAMLVTAVTAASAVPYLTRAYAGLTGADEPSQRH